MMHARRLLLGKVSSSGPCRGVSKRQCISERLQCHRVCALGLKVHAEKKPSLDLPAGLADHVKCQD